MKPKYLLLLLMFTLFACPGAVLAEEETDAPIPETGKVFTLGEVVVTGEDASADEIATTDVIDEEQMDLTTSVDVADALDTLPGVFLTIGRRNERTFSVRGFNQRYVPVFFDGIPIYVPYEGYIDTGKLPTANLSEITLTKGNSSVLYGPNAMGGVVNILSKKPEKSFEGDFRMGGRQSNTFDSSLYLGSKQEKFYVTASGSYLGSDGYLVSDNFTPTPIQGDGVRENSDINERNASFKFGFTPAEGHEYAVGINYIDSTWGLPPQTNVSRPKYWRYTDWQKTTYYFIGDSEITDDFSTRIRIYRDTYYNVLDSYDNDKYNSQTKRYAFHSTYDDFTNGGSLTLRSTYIPQNLTSFSFHYRDDVHRSQGDYNEEWERYETETFSFGLEDDYNILPNLAFVVGLSYDLQKPIYANGGELRDDDTSFNPQAGVHWTCLEDLGLHFSVGKKTRFPTLKELYSGYDGSNLPNPNLASEESINYEIGAEKPLPGRNSVGLNLFYSDIKNLIVEKEISEDLDQYQNIGKATYKGIEFFFKSGFFKNNMFELNYTYLNTQNDSPDRTSDHIPDTPENKLYVSDLYEFCDYVSLFGKAEWYSKRWYEDSDTGWQTLDGFITVDLKLIGTISEHFTAEVGVENMFDENYFLSDGFPREGRTIFGRLQVNF